MMNRLRVPSPLACILSLTLLLGCGSQDPRRGLSGTVTLDGEPLALGSISFRGLRGTSGPTAGGEIKEGQFIVPRDGGTFTGTFRVEISATRKTGKQVQDPLLGMMVDEFEQIIPKQYNLQSELSVEVTADGPNEYEFALESTP